MSEALQAFFTGWVAQVFPDWTPPTPTEFQDVWVPALEHIDLADLRAAFISIRRHKYYKTPSIDRILEQIKQQKQSQLPASAPRVEDVPDRGSIADERRRQWLAEFEQADEKARMRVIAKLGKPETWGAGTAGLAARLVSEKVRTNEP